MSDGAGEPRAESGATMIATLGPRLLEAYQNPRVSARRILAAQPSRSDAMTMILAGAVLNVLAATLAESLSGESLAAVFLEVANQNAERAQEIAEADPVGQTLLRAAQSLGFFLTAGLTAFFFGARANGRGDVVSLLAVSGWWSIVWAPANLAGTLAVLMMGPAGLTAAIGFNFGLELILLYVFAAFVAEAHGFQSAWRVMMAALGVLFVGAILLTLVVTAAGFGPTGG